MIGADEMARLRIPLNVVCPEHPMGLIVCDADDMWGVVVCRPSDGHELDEDEAPSVLVCWNECGTDANAPEWVSIDDLWVSVEVAQNADSVARWLADRVDFEVGCTAPVWVHGTDHDGNGGWTLVWFDDGDSAEYYFGYPELEDLDWERLDRLPDGSRYVDRLALALVAVHVGAKP